MSKVLNRIKAVAVTSKMRGLKIKSAKWKENMTDVAAEEALNNVHSRKLMTRPMTQGNTPQQIVQKNVDVCDRCICRREYTVLWSL